MNPILVLVLLAYGSLDLSFPWWVWALAVFSQYATQVTRDAREARVLAAIAATKRP